MDIWIVQHKETGDIISAAREMMDAIRIAVGKEKPGTPMMLDRIELF